uniref:Fibropellin-1-like n=1 Tax=Saccoglossus kowalevskii TaxID=10224 RepID=A0ABM0M0F2_SACKO|nr:PREDICTED: fibropellin-1-like [Saccoglossus kowalevskii]
MKTVLVFGLVLLAAVVTVAQDACDDEPCGDLGPCYERPTVPETEGSAIPPYVCECPGDEYLMGETCQGQAYANNAKETCFGIECSSGYFTSPNYPNNYFQRHRTLYLLYIPGCTSIKFWFSTDIFEIEVQKDELYIGPGLTHNQPLMFENMTDPLQYVYEGFEAPSPITIPGDAVYILWLTDKTIEHRGWRLNWEMTGFDPCLMLPCRNGGTCTVMPNGVDYECACMPCWEGPTCQIAYDMCSDQNPCLNNAVCQMLPECLNVECNCVGCYSGVLCETFEDQCVNPNPCFNAGTCTRVADSCSEYTCQSVDLCQVNDPCGFNGVCIMEDNCLSVSCQCSDCWVGQYCDVRINQCDGAPCQNGGTCIAMGGCQMFSCICTSCYTGTNCEIHLDPCSTNPCINGGTCMATSCNTYQCSCLGCYTGTNCQECEFKAVNRPSIVTKSLHVSLRMLQREW